MCTQISLGESAQQRIKILVVGLLDNTIQQVDFMIIVILVLVTVMDYDSSSILSHKKGIPTI